MSFCKPSGTDSFGPQIRAGVSQEGEGLGKQEKGLATPRGTEREHFGSWRPLILWKFREGVFCLFVWGGGVLFFVVREGVFSFFLGGGEGGGGVGDFLLVVRLGGSGIFC